MAKQLSIKLTLILEMKFLLKTIVFGKIFPKENFTTGTLERSTKYLKTHYNSSSSVCSQWDQSIRTEDCFGVTTPPVHCMLLCSSAALTATLTAVLYRLKRGEGGRGGRSAWGGRPLVVRGPFLNWLAWPKTHWAEKTKQFSNEEHYTPVCWIIERPSCSIEKFQSSHLFTATV